MMETHLPNEFIQKQNWLCRLTETLCQFPRTWDGNGAFFQIEFGNFYYFGYIATLTLSFMLINIMPQMLVS